MWCLENKSGPSLTATCPLYSHKSWWASDLQQNLRPCNQTCSVCFGRDHHLDGFLLPVGQTCMPPHTSTSLGKTSQLYPFIKPLCPGFKHHHLPPFFAASSHLFAGPWPSLCPPGHSGLHLQLRLPPSHNKSLCSSELTDGRSGSNQLRDAQ